MSAQVLAATATTLAAWFLVPQIARLLRHGDTAGVSVLWAAFGLVTNAAWVVYLGTAGLWAAAVAPGLAVATYGALLWVLLPSGGWGWTSLVGLYSVGLALVGWSWSAEAFGLALAGTPAVQLLPQVVVAFRERLPIGLSPVTWTIGLLEAVLWAIYGMIVVDVALIGYGIVTCVGAVLVLAAWWFHWGRHAWLRAENPPKLAELAAVYASDSLRFKRGRRPCRGRRYW